MKQLQNGMYNKVEINSQRGGNGDIWMRLAGLYVVAAMQPSFTISISVPPFMAALADHIFGDRLIIRKEVNSSRALTYTSLGIKDLLAGVSKGKRYISPYGRVVLYKKNNRARWLAGNLLYQLLDISGTIQSAPINSGNVYQGFQEIVAIKRFRKMRYQNFCLQLQKDIGHIQYKFTSGIPLSSRLQIPGDLQQSILFFPTGTARQFVPVWWAKRFLPGAYYAFFHKDEMARAFIAEGLKVVYFYEEPGDIIELSKHAWHTVSTDSFPSHLLQYAHDNCTITITEMSPENVIRPFFGGSVIKATAPCHPCLHLDRKNNPYCAAGFSECINWKSEVYTGNILASVAAASITGQVNG